MTKNNVIVSINSDDSERRRLNTEAAKSIKYGNLDLMKLKTCNNKSCSTVTNR